jgi:hypothetical protein
MKDAEGSIKRPPGMGIPSSAPSRRRSILAALLLAPFLGTAIWECGHRIKFGDFFSYGYHTDLVENHSDIGVPRLYTSYCLRVTNFTLFSIKFEGHQWPSGTTDSEISYHDRLEKWNQQSHSWSTVFEFGEGSDPSAGHANTVTTVSPGRSIYPSGCYEVATVEGIHTGDTLRLAAFTSYSKPEGGPGQRAFYSLAFVVNKNPPETHTNQANSQVDAP